MSQGKRVIIINQFAGTPVSGWGERHFYLAKHWLNQGYQVTIVSSAKNHMFNRPVSFSGIYKHQLYQDVSFVWVNIPNYNPANISRFWSMLVFHF